MNGNRPRFDWNGYVAGYLESLKGPRIRSGWEEQQAALVDLHNRVKALEALPTTPLNITEVVASIGERVEALEGQAHGHALHTEPSKDEIIARLTVGYEDLRSRVAQFVEWLLTVHINGCMPNQVLAHRTTIRAQLREFGLITKEGDPI